MARVDVFKKYGKNFLVPIYLSDFAHKKLPYKAVLANKGRQDWTVMDDTFDFRFSLFPNDLIAFEYKKMQFYVYYRSLDISNAKILADNHDRSWSKGKRFGSKTLKNLKKYEIDMLGNYYEVKQETRRGLE